MAAQILLDNPSRGSTALLASCVPPTTSDQLLDGTTPGDDTGDTAFNGGRKLKQWAADLNAMLAVLLGTTAAFSVTDTPGIGPIYDYSPGAFTLPGTKRLILNPSGGSCAIGGIDATGVSDGYTFLIYNANTSVPITFLHLASGETAPANQISNAYAASVQIPPLGAAPITYIAGSVNKWVFV